MLNLLRRVSFPVNLQTSGYLIKASLLHHVKNYQDILHEAELEKQKILTQAKLEAKQITDQARLKAIEEVQSDLQKLKESTYKKEEELKKQSTSICLEICQVVLEKFIESATDGAKIRTLIEALLERSHSARTLDLRANPEQVTQVEESLMVVLGEQFNLRKWTIHPDPDLAPFELKISTTNGSEINVSIQNLVHMFQSEIDALATDVTMCLQHIEVGNESRI